MEISIDPHLAKLVLEVEKDLAKAIKEAVSMWLKQRILTCPITNEFCINSNSSCNDCKETDKIKK